MHLHNILSMGGYGTYVWTAYVITLSVLTINTVSVIYEKKKNKKTFTKPSSKK